MHSFHCPYCSVPLRVRDMSYRGRTIPCPECRQPVVIREAADGLVGVRGIAEIPLPVPHKRGQAPWSIGHWAALAVAVLLILGAGWWISSRPKHPQLADVKDGSGKLEPEENPLPVPPAADNSPIDVLLADHEEEPILPLVEVESGELPGVADIPSVPPAVSGMPPELVIANNEPIEVWLADDGPGFDIHERLAQPILGFRPTKALSLEDMLFEVQELLGAPIDLSDIPPELRQKTVMLELGETTVGKILDRVTQAGEVAYDVDPRKIVIRPGGVNP